jgi:UDP-2-acetamido-3-amino-2,3-dideoxy-glucuronate N-acetyltransferase
MQNVAVVGFGYWGKNLVRNFHELGALRLICDTDPAKQQLASKQYPQAGFCTSLANVLDDDDVRAVAIATPAATHFEVTKKALLAGKDVLVEKPLALSLAEGRQLVELAGRCGKILMVGHLLLYHPAIIKLGELVRNGELGYVRYLYSNRLNMGKIRREENILWSFAPHDISAMLALLQEEPCSICCIGGSYVCRDVTDVTISEFLFPSGVRAHIFVSWLHPFKEQRLVVVGSEKMAVFDDTAANKLVLYPHRVNWLNRLPVAVKADAQIVAVDDTEPLRTECQHFLQCLQTRQKPLTSGEEALGVLKVLQSCQKCLDDHRRIEQNTAVCPPRPAGYFAHETACIDQPCQIGEGTKVWHFCHISKDARIGANCILGQNVFVGGNVVIGSNVKVQNNVSIYTGAVIEDDVFLGPSCVLTNVSNPRSQIVRHSLYEKTYIRRGATVGANATVVCGVELGRYCFIAAGAVVTGNVPDYALMMGVPARQLGWMSRHGVRLPALDSNGIMVCPESSYRYKEIAPGVLRCLDLDEQAALPAEQRVGRVRLRELKKASTAILTVSADRI